MENENKEYIGDGVYVSYDGYHFVLDANLPTTDTIYLDRYVANALIKYIESYWLKDKNGN